MDENKFPMVAKTFQGLEDVLRDELISLGAENVEMGRRMVSFEGDLAMMYKANLCCRTALRILKPIEKFTASDPDELYDMVREIEWEKYMTPETTFAIDSTVSSEDFTHSKYVTYRVKDGIVDHFRDKAGVRPSVRVTGADVMFNVHIFEDRVTISLDSSGEPLSKRGYKVDQTKAPINEVLAAGIIMKTGWRGDCNFVDPMCGSGTFLTEAALIAANINPGIYRQEFAFEKWPDFDKDLFEELYNDDSAECEFSYKIYGGDIDPEAVAIARKNIREAKVEDMIELSCRPMSEWTDNPDPGILITNPPYGERLRPEDMTALYKGIGTSLKQNFSGWHAWIIGLNDEDFANIGLKPSVKIPLLNGNLECSLREYVLFDGRYSDFRAEGGSVGHYDEDDERRAPRKMKHLSDDEWRKETHKYGHDTKKKPSRHDDRKDGGDRFRKPARSDRGDKFDRNDRFERSDRFERKDRFDADDRFERSGKFGRSDRDDRRGGKGFKGGRDDRGGKGDFRGKGDFGGKRDSGGKGGFRKDRGPVITTSRGPRLPESDAIIFSERPMRSRRPKKTGEDEI